MTARFSNHARKTRGHMEMSHYPAFLDGDVKNIGRL